MGLCEAVATAINVVAIVGWLSAIISMGPDAWLTANSYGMLVSVIPLAIFPEFIGTHTYCVQHTLTLVYDVTCSRSNMFSILLIVFVSCFLTEPSPC